MVHTPWQYEQFKAGTLGAENDMITIKYDSHGDPLIFEDAKFYATSKYYSVLLWGHYRGHLTVRPHDRYCDARFYLYDNQFQYLPEDFHTYLIHYQHISSGDIDSILRWRSAKTISVECEGDGDVAYALTQRVDELKLMQAETMLFNVHRDVYSLLNVTVFLENVKHLRWIVLIRADDREDYREFEGFVRNQQSSDLFDMETSWRHIRYNRKYVEKDDTPDEIQYVDHYDRITISYYDLRQIDGNQTEGSYAKREIVNTFGCSIDDDSHREILEAEGFSESLKQYCRESSMNSVE